MGRNFHWSIILASEDQHPPRALVVVPLTIIGVMLRLIERFGIDAKLFDWSDEITADCPRKQARNLNDQCGARCPDLPKVV